MATKKSTPKAARATARGIRVSRAVADRTKKIQAGIHALGDVLSGTPATVEALTDFAGQVGVLDQKLAELPKAATVREALLAVQSAVSESATARLTAIVAGTADTYPNQATAVARGQKSPVPVTAK